MSTQNTMNRSNNPYSEVLFPTSSGRIQVQNIIDSTLARLDEINGKNSEKNQTYTLSSYISTFLTQTDNEVIPKRREENPQRFQLAGFASMSQISNRHNSSAIIPKIHNSSNAQNLLRAASAPPIHRELPKAPDPSYMIQQSPEKILLPPFLWEKPTKQPSTSSDYEDIQQPPPPPVHRRRGRPRKNPLPEDYYAPPASAENQKINQSASKDHFSKESSSHSKSFRNKSLHSNDFHSSQSQDIEETSENALKFEEEPSSQSKTNSFDKSNRETSDSFIGSPVQIKQESEKISKSIRTKEISDHEKLKLNEDEHSLSSGDENSEEDIEEITIPEPRPPKNPEIEFPDSKIDEICGQNKSGEYLIKFTNSSYGNSQWIPKSELLANSNYLETFKCFEKFGITNHKPYFNPLFLQPERLLDIKDDQYLIKWTGLPFKYSTWEANKPNDDLIGQYEVLQNHEEFPSSIKFEPINIDDQFSLDDAQNEVVNELYKKFCNHEDSELYGTIGSILRLEIAALFSVIKDQNGIRGPYLLVVAPPILDLAVYEMSTYTELTVLKIPDTHDVDEITFIRDNAFCFEGTTNPKFDILVVSSNNFEIFAQSFPKLNYAVAAIDTSEMIESPLPELNEIGAIMHITVQKRTEEEIPVDSQDDSTYIHSELTVFCPMLKNQRQLYEQVISENMEILTKPSSEIDKSHLYEVVTKICALANSPALLNSQDAVFRKANPMMKKKLFDDSGKMRCLQQLIYHATNQNQRLMVICRDPVVLDTLQLFATAYDIQFVRVGALGVKRRKLDDFMPEAKVNKKIIVLAQFEKQPINWLRLSVDIIVVFDGVYNPMYYFTHASRKPRKRDCLIIRLLSADSHEAYLASCADHYEELPMLEIFKAAAETYMRPARETVLAKSYYLENRRFDYIFNDIPLAFQYMFDEDRTPRFGIPEQSNDNWTPDASFDNQSSHKRKRLASLSASLSASNLTENILQASLLSPRSQSRGKKPEPGHDTPKKSPVNEIKSPVKREELEKEKLILEENEEKNVKLKRTQSSPRHAIKEESLVAHNFPEEKAVIDHLLESSNTSSDKKSVSLKQVKSEPAVLIPEQQPTRKYRRKIIRKYRLEQNQEIPASIAHGKIVIKQHHHRRKRPIVPSTEDSVVESAQSQIDASTEVTQSEQNDTSEAVDPNEQSQPSESTEKVQEVEPSKEQPDIKKEAENKSQKDEKHSTLSLPSSSNDFLYYFYESPSSLKLNEGEKDNDWTRDETNSALLIASRRPWGQWEEVTRISKVHHSPFFVRSFIYILVKSLLSKTSSSYPLLKSVLSDHKKLKKNLDDNTLKIISKFVNKYCKKKRRVHYRLHLFNAMLGDAIAMATSTQPPTDIKVFSAKRSPASWWTTDDDKAMLWHIWTNGYILSDCAPSLWSGNSLLPPHLLNNRFNSLIKENENGVMNKRNIIFPQEIKYHPVNIKEQDELDRVENSPLYGIVKEFGFLDVSDLCLYSHMEMNAVQSEMSTMSQILDVAIVVDFFQRLRNELLLSDYYYTEDLQIMEAVQFHGTKHSYSSLLLQSHYKNLETFSLHRLFEKIESCLENKRKEIIEHTNTPYNSLGSTSPVLPIVLSEKIQVTTLGEIVHKPLFHSKQYIYPVGYESIVNFYSAIKENESCDYVCQILEDAENDAPIFKVFIKDQPEISFIDGSPDLVWKQIADKVNSLNNITIFESTRTPGHELFGLSFPLVLRFIQSLHGCDQCTNYRLRAFKVSLDDLKNNHKVLF